MLTVRNIKILGRNRDELWLSFLLVGIGFMLSSEMPITFRDLLIAVGSSLMGFFCALNAALDADRMCPPERVICVSWLGLVSFWLLFNLTQAFTTTAFSPM